MKTMKKILGLFLLSIAFVSCGSDDDGPEVVQKTIQKELKYSNGIYGFADSKSEVTMTLDLKDQFEFASEFTAGKWINLNNFFKVEGFGNVDSDLVLKDVKITIGTAQPVSLGTCKLNAVTGNKEFAPDAPIAYEELGNTVFKPLFTALTTGNRVATVKVEFTPSKDVNRDKLKFTINVYGDITYKTYPNGK